MAGGGSQFGSSLLTQKVQLLTNTTDYVLEGTHELLPKLRL